MKLNVLKQASLSDALTAELARRYHLVELTALTDADFRALAGTFTVLITNGEATVTRELIASLPALELIAVFGVGYDGVDVQAAAEHQVRVSHTPGVLTDDVADLALGLMLATSRQIVAAHKFIEAGEWAAGGFPWTQKVSGSRVGIVGMGRIGQAIARRCEGFAMQIAYHDRKRLPALNYAWREDLLTLAAESDFLVICTPGTAANQGLINQPVLAALGEKGILINISRGSVIDEPALVAALESGIIAGAGLDVFSHEPAVPAGLLQRSNVVVTPHMASATWSTRAAMAQLVLDNVACWAEKKALVTPVAESLAD
ncbi:2-hydroxyacid dehydrogenase [Klebsiella variicola]|uniref:2-hydroxyacid dehydrogenase n=1 Tax=Klebsiella variicola TaxID=244366 RepID=UPI0009BB6CF9|nr:2-hydroxyacid dehydrogenase [Klebsiella variicola]HDZ9769782.1 2-hydroxyacid dehydrogenase [Klebsiella variicola subsp. variicola]ELA1950377.1 2-hydroxyacid dehydrogenase [Klebsiella variicola]OZQ45324.1 2-hydroxyacid dehydrogenase [Klebsiella variicola]SLU76603.1 D-isomer specific 2-hydroxyacid dehydrogenase family protein [Klebsiella variicola]SLW19990.1 D-isomer specific 2-hydroxyacid dehydrogenase family protein [Klebsiella variicola]